MNKEIAFPNIRRFSDLFGEIEPKKDRPFADKAVISNWLHYSKPYRSEYREPRPIVLEYIRGNMLPVDYDSIYFEVIDRGDNETLIVAKYNQIIGSRWLAIVDTDSVKAADWCLAGAK